MNAKTMVARRAVAAVCRSAPLTQRCTSLPAAAVAARGYSSGHMRDAPILSRTQSSGTTALAAMAVAAAAIAASSDRMAEASAPQADIAAIKKDIGQLIAEDTERRGDGSSIGPTLVRLAWHASGTYDKATNTGGSNGATMRYPPESAWAANAGLDTARKALEALGNKYPAISTADLWTLGGVVAIEEMGGPVIPWRPGRTDSSEPTKVLDGRLPDADKGKLSGTVQHIRDIFYRMGFNDREIVALSGAHALGRCHTTASGYWGPWTNAETTFSNEYFRLLVEEKWTLKRTHQGKKWTGPDQFENPDGNLMMLPSDIALTWDKDFRQVVELYAKDEEAFFKDFSAAFSKLLELGVPFPGAPGAGALGIGGIFARIKAFLGF